MATQAQRSETTRSALLKAFRTSFLKRGYEATTTQMILGETGLSKGALYHHFRSKTDIIEAIYEAESRAAIDKAVQSVDPAAPPLERLRAACLAWLSEVRTPGVAKILFDIGPSALGQSRAREIEDAYSLQLLESLFREAVERGDIAAAGTKLATSLVNALVAEAALYTLRTGTQSDDMFNRIMTGFFAALKA